MKQNLREAELALARKRAEMTIMQEEEQGLRDELLRVDKLARSLDEDVALALQSGNEELARFAIRSLLPQRETQRGLEARIDTVQGRLVRLGETVAAQEESFVELKGRVRAQLVASRRAASSECGPNDGFYEPHVPDEAVEVELLRRRTTIVAEQGGC